MTIALDAFIIHKYPQGETSMRVTLFTAEKGITNCLCKGIRTSRKGALLQPFIPLWITLDRREKYLQQIEIRAPVITLVNDALFAGMYINELIWHSFRPGMLADNHGIFFAEYYTTIKDLISVSHDSRQQMAIILRNFERKLLTCSGYAINFTHDIHGEAIDERQNYLYKSDSGFIPVDMPSSCSLSGHYIQAIAANDYSNPSILSAARVIMQAALDHALSGKIIKAREIFASYTAHIKQLN